MGLPLAEVKFRLDRTRTLVNVYYIPQIIARHSLHAIRYSEGTRYRSHRFLPQLHGIATLVTGLEKSGKKSNMRAVDL